jgi:7-cyano-7-deazaguanine synthase
MPDTPTHDLVILASGGYDSTVLLHIAKAWGYHPIALLVDYGQKHVRELEAGQRVCDGLGIETWRMTVDLSNVNSGLTGALHGGQYEGVHAMHVPGRNTIFVGLALSLAESVGARKIWYGANYEDCINRFPDCLQSWVLSMNESLQRGASYPIELEAPLLGLRKETILRWGKSLGIKEEEVHSGYDV